MRPNWKTMHFTISLLLAFAWPSFSQSINTPKLDSLFNAIAAHKKGMGSVIISKDGNIVYSRGFGYSQITDDTKTPAKPETIYRVGSVSKMFTAAMVFQLIEENKIQLTTTLDKFFPSIQNSSTITMQHLLSHRSGLRNFIDDTSWRITPKTKDQMLAMFTGSASEFEPGSKYNYSNTNYILLGYIIEVLSGKSYGAALYERIISKANLHNTYYDSSLGVAPERALPYLYAAGRWNKMPRTHISILGGAGGLVSSAPDLLKFAEALFSHQLVSEKSLAQMMTIIDGYGMGIKSIPFYNYQGYGHTGSIDGYQVTLSWFPAQKLAVAYCSNGVVTPINDILIGILSICFNEPYTITTYNESEQSSESLDKYLGIFDGTDIELNITITKDNKTLIAQANGQGSFPLTSIGDERFVSDHTGIELKFSAAGQTMILKQLGHSFKFQRRE